MLCVSGVSLMSAQSAFTIEGSAQASLEGKTIYLTKPDIGKIPVDSAVVKNGKFSFAGEIQHQTVGYVSEGRKGFHFVIEPGIIRLSFSSEEMGGTPSNDKLNAYLQSVKPHKEQMLRLREEAAGYAMPQDSAKLMKMQEDFNNAYFYLNKVTKDYIFDNLDNVGPAILLSSIRRSFTEEELARMKEKACPALRENPSFLSVVNERKGSNAAEVGRKYTDVKMQAADGREVALSDYAGHGKYILVDFWASWCAPCRKEMPAVKAAYEKFKGKGFEVIGVSFDSDKGAWLKAVKDLSLPWPQISDLKGGGECIAGLIYGVKAIPFTLLINPEGIIVATNLRGSELEKTLSQYLK